MFMLKEKSNLVVIILLIVGAIFLFYGSWQIVHTKAAQENALDVAKSKIKNEQGDPIKEVERDYQFEKGEAIGVLQIPRIKAELPIIEGTEEEELQQGVGHFIGSSYPAQNDQIVLSGHRDTVFENLGELVAGDQIIVEMPDGKYTYEITDTEIVDADDRTVIRSTAPNEVLTLTTCYPFNFIGNAPERYIVYAEPVF